MICRKCKKELPEGAVFCMYCGTRLVLPPKKPKQRANGTGSVWQDAKTGTWTACVTKFVGGQKHTRSKRGFKRKKDALAALPGMSFDADLADASKITFAELYKLWSDEYFRDCSDSKRQAYEIAYKRCEPLYYRAWRLIRLSEMQAVVDGRPSYYTARDVRNLLSLMGQFAIKHELFDRNRAEYITLPRCTTQEKRSFTEEEILMLWEDHDNGHEFTAYALLMIYTGMRPGELMQMKIADVHLDATPPYMIGGIKTEAGKNRMFPIAKAIVPLVERMCERGKKKLLEMNEDNFRKAFDEMTARAGTRPLKPHECRHTFCSELALQGVQPGVIMRIAGHANYQTTAGYTHIQQLEESAKAVDKIG